ncbi:hypothetical protein I312_100818 [Cryptococcus bacillisporus CA1280]|uniref:uncharacterized protein n=1 Tax=Cryptococcus bacillisporus CA1280 TaxID=1296109 RepID=UPI003367076F
MSSSRSHLTPFRNMTWDRTRTVMPYHGSIILLFLNSYGIPPIVISNNHHNCAVQKSSGAPHAANQKGMEKHKERQCLLRNDICTNHRLPKGQLPRVKCRRWGDGKEGKKAVWSVVDLRSSFFQVTARVQDKV